MSLQAHLDHKAWKEPGDTLCAAASSCLASCCSSCIGSRFGCFGSSSCPLLLDDHLHLALRSTWRAAVCRFPFLITPEYDKSMRLCTTTMKMTLESESLMVLVPGYTEHVPFLIACCILLCGSFAHTMQISAHCQVMKVMCLIWMRMQPFPAQLSAPGCVREQ